MTDKSILLPASQEGRCSPIYQHMLAELQTAISDYTKLRERDVRNVREHTTTGSPSVSKTENSGSNPDAPANNEQLHALHGLEWFGD